MKKIKFTTIFVLLSLFISITAVPAKSPVAHAEESAELADIVICGNQRYDFAFTEFELVNQNRQANGKSSLAFSSVLTELAMQRAVECALCHSHVRPNGQLFNTVDENNTYSFGYLYAENIAIGYKNPEAVMTGWMNSEGHRANILNTKSQSIGIGCFYSDGTLCWVQIFGTGVDPVTPTENSSVYKEVTVTTTVDLIILTPPDTISANIGSTAEFPMLSLVNAEWKYGNYNAKPFITSGYIAGGDGQPIASINQSGTITALAYGSGVIQYRLYPGQSTPYTLALNVRTENGSVLTYSIEGLQSPHPYETDTVLSLQYSYPFARSLKITFSPETEVENEYDFITIYDAHNNEVGLYTGTELAGVTLDIPGDTFTIVLESDISETRYGFKVTSIEPDVPEENGLRLINGSGYYILNGVIGGVSTETLYRAFADQFISPVAVKDGNNLRVTSGFIGTGFTVSSGSETASVTVKYDTDGNGIITGNDYLTIKLHFKNIVTLNGVYFSSADIDGNGKLTVGDYLRVKRRLSS